jgi:hypothetical protein
MTEQIYSKIIVLASVVAVMICAGGYYLYRYATTPPLYKTTEESDVYVRFVMEGYDSIIKNYWMETKENDLAHHFALSVQKAQSLTAVPVPSTSDRAGVSKMLHDAFTSATTTEAKKHLAEDTLKVALYNLNPIGRNALYSREEETQMRQTVSNVNPSSDLYKSLGLAKGASADEVNAAYKEKETVLKSATTTEAKQELAEATHAQAVLANPSTKTRYDDAKIEPTIWSKMMGKTLYLSLEKIAPTTLQEFGAIVETANTTSKADSVIIDFRGNIGGALDFLQYFLGLFVGKNQFAFDLFHQGAYDAQRTVTDKWDGLLRYKEIAFLTDQMTQSTAELTAATFKRLHLGVVVGEPTRGWGSVENTYPLETVIDPKEKYSLLLVHSLTLRDDNQPIEQHGVDPDIDTRKSGWENKLSDYLRSPSLVRAVSKVVSEPPLRK